MSDDMSDISDNRAARFGTPDGELEASQCQTCVHYEGGRRCRAFGTRDIPVEILENSFDHRKPHPNDDGTTWTPRGDAKHPRETWSGAHE